MSFECFGKRCNTQQGDPDSSRQRTLDGGTETEISTDFSEYRVRVACLRRESV